MKRYFELAADYVAFATLAEFTARPKAVRWNDGLGVKIRRWRDGKKEKEMEWTSVETPPEMRQSEWWLESDVVLVFDEQDGTMRTATYEQIDEDSAPCWYSADSERWTLETVTHWMPLPPAPNVEPRKNRKLAAVINDASESRT